MINLLKHLVLVILLCLMFSGISRADELNLSIEITVGLQPSAIHYDADNKLYHIICIGFDSNYNGVFEPDSGDEKASWWILPSPSLSNAEKVMEFEFGFMGFPFRPCFSDEANNGDGLLFISHLGRIRSFSLSTYQLVDDEVAPFPADAISYKDNKLYLSQKQFNKKGSLLIYDLVEKNITDTLLAEVGVQQSLVYETSDGQKGIAIVNEGNFGSDDSKLMLVEKLGKAWSITVLELGDTGNHLAIHDDMLAVTVNGSHTVEIVDLVQKRIIKSIGTATEGWNGPRESSFITINGKTSLAVTTYEGDIRIIDLESGVIKGIYPCHGKTEALTNMTDESPFLLVANISNSDYTPDNRISIFDYVLSVSDSHDSERYIYPNPVVSNEINVSAGSNSIIKSISIVDNCGNLIKHSDKNISFGNGSFQVILNNTEIASGSYLMIVEESDKVYSLPFSIIK